VKTCPVQSEEDEDDMATDYDAPRGGVIEDETAESLETLKAQRIERMDGRDDDVDELAANLELPGADLSGELLTIPVVPQQPDEFTCNRCFLVHHRSQLVHAGASQQICRDCA
jgi:hypothetical protein